MKNIETKAQESVDGNGQTHTLAIGSSSGLGLGIDIGSNIEHSADLLPQYLLHSHYPINLWLPKQWRVRHMKGSSITSRL